MEHTAKNRLRLVLFIAAISLPVFPVAGLAQTSSSVYMQELTTGEIKSRLQAGTTIAIVPTGATEQEGPHLATGKHNIVVHYAAGEIARRLGNALVAPVIAYAPSGRISPPEGNMQFAGTISISPRAYTMMLADVARSLKQHGFHTICFVGDSMASQAGQAQVAKILSQEWSAEGVRVINVSHYYSQNGQDEWNDSTGIKVMNPGAHGGHIDTSELMAVDATGVRGTLTSNHSERDYKATGAGGDSSQASANLGQRYVSLKIEAAIKQIQNASSHAQ